MPASSLSRRSRTSPRKWDAIIAINLSSAFHAIRAAVPGMKAREMGPHHQHRLGPCAGRLALQIRLCRRQARHCRPDQDGGARSCAPTASPATHLPRLCLDAAGREADPRHDEGARPDQGAGHAMTCCSRRSRPSNSSPSSKSPRWRCSLRRRCALRSPAPTCRSMAAGRQRSDFSAERWICLVHVPE